MGLTQTAKPDGEPVTLDAFKNHARLDGDHDNESAQLLLRSATRHIEHLTARQFINATWKYTFDAWPIGPVWIPKAPLVSVTSITYLDQDGATQTVSSDTYQAVTRELPGSVVLKYGKSWPNARRDTESIAVTFVAGNGADPANVPELAKLAIQRLGTYWYWNPGLGDITGRGAQTITPIDVDSAIQNLKVFPRVEVLNG
jgi:uncharacterized phiE125 gp8 family phage protein